MFVKIAFTVLPLWVFVGCYQPERRCQDFKTGTYSFDYEVDGAKKSGVFIRTETHSIDKYEGNIDSSRVRWINDCEFVLEPLDKKAAIHYKITRTTDSSYQFEYKRAVKHPKRKLIVKTGTAIKTD